MDFCPFSNTPCSAPKVHHITDVFGKEVKQMHLCQHCFLNQYSKLIHQQVTEFILKLIKQKEQILSKKCTCGLTLEDFSKTGRLGCAACYDTFSEELMPILQSCQGNKLMHIGKKPHNYNEIIEAKEAKLDIEERIRLLKLKMAKAVEVENYEVAGVLKKKIEELRQPSSDS